MHDPSARDRVTGAARAEMSPNGPKAITTRGSGPRKKPSRIHARKRYQHGFAHLMLGMALATVGRTDEALARLTAFTDRESAQIDAASIRGYFGRVLVLWQAGRLARCEQTAADQLQLAQTNNRPSLPAGARPLGAVAHERGDLPRPRATSRPSSRARSGSISSACATPSSPRSWRIWPQGMHDEADRAVARLREFVIGTETAITSKVVDSFAARVALIRGDLAAATLAGGLVAANARGRRLQGHRARS